MLVIPAQAGIQWRQRPPVPYRHWAPACAGATMFVAFARSEFETFDCYDSKFDTQAAACPAQSSSPTVPT
ncbi:MAG TPA: hypothetical protein VJ722_09690, partial [Rhodanobacteraceae bacterium]|nr:hypothetical protein [Rhodanobacteraceae bacterium]